MVRVLNDIRVWMVRKHLPHYAINAISAIVVRNWK